MKARRAKIQAMRMMPSRSNASAVKLEEHIEWLLQLELALQDMFEIVKQSVDMERMAFGPDLVDIVYRLFPHDIQEDFAEFDGKDSKIKLSSRFEYVATLRKKRQVMWKSAIDYTDGHVGAHEYDGDNESIDDGYSDRSEMDDVERDVGNDDYFDSGSGGGPGDEADEEEEAGDCCSEVAQSYSPPPAGQ